MWCGIHSAYCVFIRVAPDIRSGPGPGWNPAIFPNPADETQDVQVKLCYALMMHAIPERLRDASCVGAI